jgi:hypothetical protein
MIKEFLMKKLIESKLKHLPKDQQEKILTVVTKNPELFQEIAVKIKAKIDGGMDQNKASMTVMMEYKDKLQKAMAQ